MATGDEKERVREATDIVAVISRYVKLRKRGSSYIGLCPFHDEKTPSFNVHPDRQFFHCFGCGKGGDVFTFLMEHERWGFPETLEHLAEQAGITLSQYRSAEQKRTKKQRENVSEALARAQRFFVQQLFEPRGRHALDYLQTRGLDQDAIRRFGLGYAPGGWDALLSASRASGFPEKILEAAGLILRSDKDKRAYDRFRDRITFPIHNLTGSVIAFGARALADDVTPKYLNSPETEVYSKSNVLFGLFHARRAIDEADEAMVVEGYMDWLALQTAGIENVVAVSGTAFTPQQARQLHRFCSRAVLVFDADAAGQKAAMRSVSILFDHGVDVRIAVLPIGEDPDSFVRQQGPDAFRKLAARSLGVIEFRCNLQTITTDSKVSGFLQRERIALDLLEIAAGINDNLKRSGFVGDIAAATGLQNEQLSDRLKGLLRQNRERLTRQGQHSQTVTAQQQPVPKQRVVLKRRWERDFLRWLLDSPDQIERFREALRSEDFEDELVARLFVGLCEKTDQKEFTLLPSALARDESELAAWSQIAAIPLGIYDTASASDDYMRRFLETRRQLEASDVRRRMLEAQASGDEDLTRRLADEFAKKGLT